MSEISVVPRSLPLVLYPPFEMSVLEIHVEAFPGQVFRLWMPVMITSPEHGEIYNQAKVGPRIWQRDSAGDTLYRQVFRPRLLLIVARARIGGDHLDLEYDVENVGTATLFNVELGTCYQLAGAPGFADQEGDRTYAWSDGRLGNILQEGVPAECHEHHHPEKSSFLHMPVSERGVGVMCVEARSGGATAMGWQTHARYVGNTDPALCCIHAGPFIAQIDPGQTLTLHGWIGWSSGPPAQICDQALALGNTHRQCLKEDALLETQPKVESPETRLQTE